MLKHLGLLVSCALTAALGPTASFDDAEPPQNTMNPPPSTPERRFEIAGRTQCVLTRKAIIAPVPLHPVTEICVSPGERVKKGQALVKLDKDDLHLIQGPLRDKFFELLSLVRIFAACG